MKREAEKVIVLECSYQKERMRFFSFPLKRIHENTGGLYERIKVHVARGCQNFLKGSGSRYLKLWLFSLCHKSTLACCCSSKAAIDKMQANEYGYVAIQLYLQKKVVGQIFLTDHT